MKIGILHKLQPQKVGVELDRWGKQLTCLEKYSHAKSTKKILE